MRGHASPPVERYLAEVLLPELHGFGLTESAASLVATDIGQRLTSLLARWHDLAFCRTACFPALEEATFYDPATAPLEIRALVVACVRNSLLEDLNASRASRAELAAFAGRVPDDRIAEVTGAAVRYFAEADLDDGPLPAPPEGDADVFGVLPGRFPWAWSTLTDLAKLEGKELRRRAEPPVAGDGAAPRMTASESVGGNGISPHMDLGLLQLLAQAKDGGGPFFTDSFKMLTRNPEKLLWILEFLLREGLGLVTFNYVVTPEYLARREPLLRPSRGVPRLSAIEIPKKFLAAGGLTNAHREALRFYARAA